MMNYDDSVLCKLNKTLIEETGMDGVSIWRKRKDDPEKLEDYIWRGTVGQFLVMPHVQNGTWLIDGGWGGPPGPIHVRWNSEGYWENCGFCGANFDRNKGSE